MSSDKHTTNVLILELATMVVAIALAFNANLALRVEATSIISFILVNIIVIWFWWEYVMDRIAYPPVKMQFPALDVLILILISLIPFVIQQRLVVSDSGLFAALMIVWGLMIRGIIREYSDTIDSRIIRKLHKEADQRVTVGILFIGSAVLGIFSDSIGRVVFIIIIVAVIVWGLLTTRKNQKEQSVATL